MLTDQYPPINVRVSCVRHPDARRYSDGLVKRLFDMAVGGVLLVVFLPVLAVAAAAVRVETPGPIFYCQHRYGLGGEPFRIFKFRTMRAELDAVFRQATADDERVTRVGALLRRTSLDELPQLINVVLGQMALVGPRPHPLALDDQYRDLIPRYDDRYLVRPGVTGLAQVNGARGETPTLAHMARRIENDLTYVSASSLLLDIRILLATVGVVVSRKNAY